MQNFNPEPSIGRELPSRQAARQGGEGNSILHHGASASQLRGTTRSRETTPQSQAGPQPGHRQRNALGVGRTRGRRI